ncbi:SOUL family heme-binding protein [Halomarina rubra]|uniref:SOUL family heme-binding protein n=1 Tax=Halomarina rubra TaxID=2071873 RepID=A0ABD6AWW2_9EURY|nr:heme-binding protein [Halomarina rubra]
MVRTTTVATGIVGGLFAAAGGWTLYQRATTEQVPYAVVETIDGVELRRYPETVLVETIASSENEAFRRLFRYISGANEGARDVEMTAPVETDRGTGESIAMTAPVEVERGSGSASLGTDVSMTAPVEAERREDGVRMAFYLPASYDGESAPRPSDTSVELSVVPERTLAVRRFSWRATDARVDRESRALLDTLTAADVTVTGDPFFMGYDAPWTLPPLRRNEVAVEVAN